MHPTDILKTRNWLKKVDAETEFPELIPLQDALEANVSSLKTSPETDRALELAREWFWQDYPTPWETGILREFKGLDEKLDAAKWRVATILLGVNPGELRKSDFLPNTVPGAVDKLLDKVLEDAEAAGIKMSDLPKLTQEELEASLMRRSAATTSSPTASSPQ
jgi:hypothetical protein